MSAVAAAPVMSAQGLTAGYGAMPVIRDVTLEVHPGEVVALLGANGAGKTTTLLALSGELPLMGGEVLMDGTKRGASLHRLARNGLSYVTEERSVFKGMSTLDNLRVAGVDPDRVMALFPELERRLHVRGGLLSGGEQQMLTLGRALARQPRVLLADELSMGLAPLVVTRLLAAVRQAADEQGTAVLLVEQHARKALRFSDRVYVMRRGRIEMSAAAAEASSRIFEIEESYLAGKDEALQA
ncbi:MAG: putative high-affinity branched-chain amino acid transport protein superfamily, atp bind [Conexibacter sp.]|nr:putative high-affinity branched-chain amino acid transport protein superfamily, atp bind [Conexibacter sp.]